MIFKRKNRVYVIVAAVVLLAIFALPPSFSKRGKGVVQGVFAPAERGSSGLLRRLSEAFSALRGTGGTVEKNRELSYELVRLRAEFNQLRNIEQENLRLRRALDFRHQQPFSLIACEVTSRNISGWWSTVRIGKGRTDGIRENQAVISPDGLVGKTITVSAHSSDVLLVSDPSFRVSAKIERANAFGLVRGEGANWRGLPMARIDFVNKDVEIRVGDEVVTSGLSGRRGGFSKGVRIGYVEKVGRDASGLYQYAQIAPSATVGLLDFVFVTSDLEQREEVP
jgi:rod shape-determining protein MreC